MRNKQQINELLDRAMEHVESVPYKVSLRWLFYRLLQEGFAKGKKDYHNFVTLFSRTRKQFKRGWKPDTLADDTRDIIFRGIAPRNYNEWIEKLECNLDKIQNQDYVILIMYEANAMTGQFQHYTKNIPLIAFGGDPSIPYKHRVAMVINSLKDRYDKPIIVLYFGDADEKGKQIRESALKDIKKWCDVQFDFIHCGLTTEQATALNLPENPDKPNEYQWEALSDEQAKLIISHHLKDFQDEKRFDEIERKEKRALSKAMKKLK